MRRFALAVSIVVTACVLAFAVGRIHDQRVGPYRGPRPAAGSPEPQGELPVASADSVVLILYGDNRPGIRLLTERHGARDVREALKSRSPRAVLAAMPRLPLAIRQAFRDMNVFRDLFARLVDHRYTGGNQLGVLRALLADPRPDLVVHSGDLVFDGRRGGGWEDFARWFGELRRRAPFLAAPGNHENRWSPVARANWDAVLGVTDSTRAWRTVDLGGGRVRVVTLDSNLLADPEDEYPDGEARRLGDAELLWADSVLAIPALWKIVVMHHPLVTAGAHPREWVQAGRETIADRRVTLLDMLGRHHVDAVFAGHEHLYQRTLLRGPGGAALWHVTSGGGGAPLHFVSEAEHAVGLVQSLPGGWRIAWMPREHSVYHYCRLVLRTNAGGEVTTADLRVYQVDAAGRATLIDRADLAQH